MKKTLSIVMSILMAMAFAAVSVTTPATVSAASAPGALYAYDDADYVDGEGIDDYDDDGRYADDADSDDDTDDDSDSDSDVDDNGSDDGDAGEEIPEENKYFVITGERGNCGFRFCPMEMDGSGQKFKMFDNASGHCFYIDTNGGELKVDQSGNYAIAYPSFRSAERSEWRLDHWNAYPDDSGEVFTPGEEVSMERLEEIGTIYAIWKKTEPETEETTPETRSDNAKASDESNGNDPTVVHRPPYVLTITDEYIQIYNEETDEYLAVQTYHAEMGYEWDDAEGAYTQEFDGGVNCCVCPVCEYLGYAQHSDEVGNDRGSSEPENQTGEEPEEEPGDDPGEEPSGDQDGSDANSADAPTVCVQGVELDEGNNAGSGWSYDEASNTLTLDNFTYTGTGLFTKPESGEEDPGDEGEDPDDLDGEEGVDDDYDWDGEEGIDDDYDWDGEEGIDDDEDWDDEEDVDDDEDWDGEEGVDEDDDWDGVDDDADDPEDEGEDRADDQVKGVICSDGDLTLKLNGESSISVIDLDSDASYGINVAGELKIEGDGFLTVKSIKETKTYGEKKEDMPEGEENANRGEGDTNSNSNDNSADNNQNATEGDTNQNATGGDANQNVTGGDANQSVTEGDANQSITGGDSNQTVNGGNSGAWSSSFIGDINNYVSSNPYISPYTVVEATPCSMCAYRNTGCGKRPHEYCRMDASPKTGDEDAAGLLGSLIAAAACIITAAIVLIRRRILRA